jgi:hypothetical protein
VNSSTASSAIQLSAASGPVPADRSVRAGAPGGPAQVSRDHSGARAHAALTARTAAAASGVPVPAALTAGPR